MHLYIVQIVTISARYIGCRGTLMSPGASLWVLLVGVCSEVSCSNSTHISVPHVLRPRSRIGNSASMLSLPPEGQNGVAIHPGVELFNF
jgi:hypothetical protein